jgi:hypothetical protein
VTFAGPPLELQKFRCEPLAYSPLRCVQYRKFCTEHRRGEPRCPEVSRNHTEKQEIEYMDSFRRHALLRKTNGMDLSAA